LVLMKHGLADVVQRLPGKLRFWRHSGSSGETESAGRGKSRPVRVRLALQELGPTFIKLGQMLSTRPDLVPPEYIRELSALQDRVPPSDFTLIRRTIESELGDSIESLFLAFQTEPLAAGSIAQVHRATLQDGREVVLKVCRPDVQQTIRVECEMLENLAEWIGTLNHDSETIDLPRMVREFTEAVSREADMALERQNLQRFADNFADCPTVHIPGYVEEYCTTAILTMEYIDGVKPADLEVLQQAGLDPELLAERGADFVLQQIFEFGVFHSDPHPGNMLMLPENIVAPLDFGQVARLHQGDQELLSELVLAIVDREPGQIVRALDNANMLADATDRDALLSDAQDLMDRYYDLPLKDIPLREVISQMFRLIRRHQLKPPAQFTLMLKSLMTIESLAAHLHPDFDILSALRPYAIRFRLRQLDPRRYFSRLHSTVKDTMELASDLPSDARSILKNIKKGDFKLRVHHEYLEELTHTVDKSSNRISFSLIIAALLVASSMLTPQEGKVLGVVSLQVLGVIGYCIAAVLGLWLLVSILRSRRM
jgi:ubiquinone biosynthesis protein